MRRFRLLSLALLVSFAGMACARAVTLNEEAGQTYAVNVINELPQAMDISYDDGQTIRPLGTVQANQRQRFVVAGASGTTVTLIATNQADTRTVRRTVVLSAGQTVDVRIN